VVGSANHLLGFEAFAPDNVIDPTLVTPRTKGRDLLRAVSFKAQGDAFHARVVPTGLLARFEHYVDRDKTATSLRELTHPHERKARREMTDMPWVSIVGSATVHKSAAIRTKLSAKLKQAAALVVTRGASARVLASEDVAVSAGHGTGKGQVRKEVVQFGEELQFDEGDAGADRWLVKGEHHRQDNVSHIDRATGWTYIFWPQLAALRMPYPALVHHMRQCLSTLKREAKLKQQDVERLREVASRSLGQGGDYRVLYTYVSLMTQCQVPRWCLLRPSSPQTNLPSLLQPARNNCHQGTRCLRSLPT
jgi:hypothetical protein